MTSRAIARRGLSFPRASYPRTTTAPVDGRALLLRTVSETDWQNQVIEWAKRAGWLVSAMRDSRKLWWGSDAGVPDLLLVRAPRVVLIELKKESGELSVRQKMWRAQLEACPRIEYFAFRPSDEDEVRRVLQ